MPDLTITDHAVLRWLERVGGLDIAAVREVILADMGASRRIQNPPRRYSVRTASAVYVIVDGAVVTVTPPRSRVAYHDAPAAEDLRG